MTDEKINVLLVDDEDALLDSMRRRLQFRDFNVIAVNRGEKALEVARQRPVDVAVVDLKMPGMSGDDVVRALKDEFPWMEVIILTGHGSFNPGEEGIADKIHACLAKPCDLKTLQKVLVDAYRKTVMIRNQIKPSEMDAALSDLSDAPSTVILQKLRDMDENR